MKEKVFITSNGCMRRMLDSSKLASYFESNNMAIVDDPTTADYIILFTCAFKRSREDESFKLIDKFKKYKGELIVAGCLPKIAPTKFRNYFKGKFVATKNLDKIDRYFNDFKVKFSEVPDAHIPYNGHNTSSECNCQFAISRGCLGSCTYCCIRNAIGKLKSKPLQDCLRDYKKMLNESYIVFEILADDVGAYGLDINSSFSELLDKLSALDKGMGVSWTINELHPKWFIKYKSSLLRFVKQGKIIAIHSPIQSGSSRILGLMNRYSDTGTITKTFLEFKRANSGLGLSTHAIIGFPSETEKDLWDTLNMIRKIGFNHVWLYPYYDCENSESFKIDGKIKNSVIRRRLHTAINFLYKEKIDYECDDLFDIKTKYLQLYTTIMKPVWRLSGFLKEKSGPYSRFISWIKS